MTSGSKSKRSALQGHAVEHALVEQLVAGLHVGERRVVEDVRHEREEAVADPVQEQHVAPLAGEARSVDDEGAALEHGGEQLRPVVGVVLEIGVLDEHEVAGHVLERRADRRALPEVVRVQHDTHRAVAELAQDAACPIVAPVVDDDDLAFQRELDGAACGGRTRRRCCAR